MKRLKDLNKPFKYIVTAVIMQKNGAGLHTATSTFWDITTDGSATVRWESKTMYCIATVRPRAATLRRGRIVLTVMRRAGLWVGDLNCVACQHAHFAMQESKTRQVVAHPTPLDEVGVEAYSLSLSVGYTDKPSTSNGYGFTKYEYVPCTSPEYVYSDQSSPAAPADFRTTRCSAPGTPV